MWLRKYIYYIILSLNLVSGEYHCDMIGKNVSCTALTQESLSKNLTVSLSKEDSKYIEALSILNSTIATIKKKYFNNFKNIDSLYMINTHTNNIEYGAFSDLHNLSKLFLSDNYLRSIDSNAFATNNSLQTLDVSYNLLHDLSDFDISIFPFLTTMNVSHNRLEYLPERILTKLKEENTFYLIVDNNPWNCSHPDWSLHLTDILVEALCINNMYNASNIDQRIAILENLVQEENSDSFPLVKCSITCCLLWVTGAVWIGIIVGNICKIKSLLFTRPVMYENKNTQYDKTDLLLSEGHTN